MARYIDADKLRHMILYFADAKNLNGNHEQAKTYNHCLIMIDESKTADVVEVVRCGSCKWLNPKGRCQVFADPYIRPSTSDFCSYGERR